MDISVNQNQLSFSAKFLDNKAFREVVKYADDTKQLLELDSALNRINNANQGDILLIHGNLPLLFFFFFSIAMAVGQKSPSMDDILIHDRFFKIC